MNNNKPLATSLENTEISSAANVIEAQYQTVSVKKMRDQMATTNNIVGVEEILKKISPPKSFLYRNQLQNKLEKQIQTTSYVPMAATPKKPKKFLRLSSYEYPNFDLKHLRLSKSESHNTETEQNDQGYYSITTSSKHFIENTFKSERRCKSVAISTVTPEHSNIPNEKYQEDHFYEDLCYGDASKETNKHSSENATNNNTIPYKTKIQKLFQTIKQPFLKIKSGVEFEAEEEEGSFEEIELPKENESCKEMQKDTDEHIYENSNNIELYDVPVRRKVDDSRSNIPVEDYLEPVRLSRDYCDVITRRDDSLLGIIMTMIDTKFRRRGESIAEVTDDSSDHDDFDTQKSQEKSKENLPKTQDNTKPNMADRPLPVPLENECYYMNIDRSEAENLLKGTPDGTFVLRPSSQPEHAYTLTVSCSNAVHNVGIRRRHGGHLALGFARKGERTFNSISALIRHHRKKRLLLVIGGEVCGATTLNETPQYYQTPSSMPVRLNKQN